MTCRWGVVGWALELVGSGPSCAGGCPLPGFRKKMCREAGSSSAHWKTSSRIGQRVSGRESSGCWVASWDAGISSSRRGLAAGMLSGWQAAPIWPLLAKGGITDASAALRNISFLSSWLCCCVSDQLQKNPHLANRPSLLFVGLPGCPAERFCPGESRVEQRGQVGQELQWSGAGCLWWVCGIYHPTHNNLFEERSEQVCKKTQQMAYSKAFGGGQGGKCDCRAHCLQRGVRQALGRVQQKRGYSSFQSGVTRLKGSITCAESVSMGSELFTI